MKTEKLNEVRTLRNAARDVGGFWQQWRTKYLSNPRCDKKAASFTSMDERFASFRFTLMFDAHAGYYGNSSSSTIFSLDNKLAQKYFTRAIQQMAEPLFDLAAKLMTEDAAALTAEAEAEIAALQAMLDEVRTASVDRSARQGGETQSEAARLDPKDESAVPAEERADAQTHPQHP